VKNLVGKVAVITGAGSGIGRATSIALSRQGVAVAVCDIRPSAAEETVGLIASGGGTASSYTADVSKEDDVRTLQESVLADHGAVDILINNAGIINSSPTRETGTDAYRKVLDINLWGPINGVTVFLPHLLSRPEAHLVNVSSYAGLMGIPEMVPYSASKFAVRGLTEALQMEFHKTSLGVTVVYPGATKTSLMSNSPTMPEATKDAFTKNLMSSKSASSPEDVADAIVTAIKKNHRRVLVGKDTKGVGFATRLLAGSYPTVMAPALKKMLRDIFDA
jgi:NAD(P)-dependent dehydrogenase (short-subunit alcohol dehydrogenase family)